MKFTLSLPLAFAITSAFGSTLPSRRDVIKARQAKVARADTTDTCANLSNALLTVNLPPVGGVSIGLINACLCLSGISNFEAFNIVALAATDIAGAPATTTALTNLINTASGHAVCTYPAHATAACAASNVCNFNCGDGYTRYIPPGQTAPTACTCSAPNTVCNGVCGSFPGGCGSQTPERRRVSRRNDGPCSAGLDVCGVIGGNGWDCVNIENDMESCGGCVIPSPFAPTASSTGIDCTGIPNIDAVDCVAGTCHVRTCQTGFTVSSSHDGCVAVDSVVKVPVVAAGEVAMGLVGGLVL